MTISETGQPAAWRAPKGFLWIYVALMISMLLGALDQTIVSTALPTVVGELNSVSKMSWVVTAYTLAATIGMPIYGKFGDVLGRKWLFVGALVIFLAGSTLCGLSQSIGQLIAFRAVQGLGGAGLMVLSQAIIADVVPARERARYMAPLGAVFGLASVVGPLLGGLLTDYAHWRWIFWINLPLGAVAIVASVLLLKDTVVTHAKLTVDWLGIAAMAIAVSGLTLIVGLAGTRLSWTSPGILALGALTVAAAIAFIIVETRARDPIIPMHLFRSRIFTIATGLGILAALGMFSAVAYVPTYLQMVFGINATISGYMLIPMVAAITITGIVSGALISRRGHYRIFPIIGMATMGLALYLLSTMSAGQPVWIVPAYLAVLGAGLGCVLQVLVLIVQNDADPAEVGTATSANNFFREIGATMGVTVVGGLFANRLGQSLGTLDLPSGDRALSTMEAITPALLQDLPTELRSEVIAAYAGSLTPIYAYLVPVFALALIIAFFLPEKALAESNSPAEQQ